MNEQSDLWPVRTTSSYLRLIMYTLPQAQATFFGLLRRDVCEGAVSLCSICTCLFSPSSLDDQRLRYQQSHRRTSIQETYDLILSRSVLFFDTLCLYSTKYSEGDSSCTAMEDLPMPPFPEQIMMIRLMRLNRRETGESYIGDEGEYLATG
jgi:hypothetical protein